MPIHSDRNLGSIAIADAHPTGIDVSHFQGEVNWSSVKAAGQSFVAIKATEGTSGSIRQFLRFP